MTRLLTLALGALLYAGCATTAPAPLVLDRDVLLARATGRLTYKRPPEEVLEALKTTLDEQGYHVLPSSQPYYVHTDWKVEGDPDISSHWSRVLVQCMRFTDGRFVVRAYEQVQTTVGRAPAHPSLGGGNRDAQKGGGGNTNFVEGEPLAAAPVVTRRAMQVEWALLARLEPRFAKAVEREVDVFVYNHQPPEEIENAP
ncbi:hypothetical protein P2318_31150 [Myxococcaceae bacterium GXIMD 01537]